MIRVFVVAAMMAMRAGLRSLLGADSQVEVTGEAASLVAAEHSLSAVDVLVIADETLLPTSFEAALARLETPPGLLVLTDEAASTQDLLGLHWRAWGILPADASPEELAAAVRALHEGLVVGPPGLLKAALNQPALDQDLDILPSEVLTTRETEVLQLLAEGMANKQISLSLGISEHTVKFHVSALYTKLGVSNRTEAVRKGFQRGLVTL